MSCPIKLIAHTVIVTTANLRDMFCFDFLFCFYFLLVLLIFFGGGVSRFAEIKKKKGSQ